MQSTRKEYAPKNCKHYTFGGIVLCCVLYCYINKDENIYCYVIYDKYYDNYCLLFNIFLASARRGGVNYTMLSASLATCNEYINHIMKLNMCVLLV